MIKHNFRDNNRGAQPVINRRKLIILPLAFENNSPQLFFKYDQETTNARTTGIRLVGGGTVTDSGLLYGSNLVTTPDGTPIANSTILPEEVLQYLMVYFCSPKTDTTRSAVLIQRPAIAFLGNNVDNQPFGYSAFERMTQKVNKRIDYGNSFVKLISPRDIAPGLALVFAIDYEAVNLP